MASVADRIEQYRGGGKNPVEEIFGPGEIHQMVKDGVLSWEEVKKYFTENQNQMNKHHRDGGTHRWSSW